MKPFLKWAGGKRQLLPHLRTVIKRPFVCYVEPFVGGGAMLFDLPDGLMKLAGDTNERLIRTYRGVRDSCDQVIELLRGYPNDPDFFLQMRATPIDLKKDAEVAAWFIYLNRTCFNGLYRVNRSNQFNVPFGRYVNPTICDEPTLRACSAHLQDTLVESGDFRNVHDRIPPQLQNHRTVVYFDPPYVPLSPTASFTGYTPGGFTYHDHERLAHCARELKRLGMQVVVSNSDTPTTRELYRGFKLKRVKAKRRISCRATTRNPVGELIIT